MLLNEITCNLFCTSDQSAVGVKESKVRASRANTLSLMLLFVSNTKTLSQILSCFHFCRVVSRLNGRAERLRHLFSPCLCSSLHAVYTKRKDEDD